MYINIIFFCFYFVVRGYSFSSSDFKYIDLLPEKEKQEFMDKVARRILSEIKPIGPPKEQSIVLTDDELNKNSNYVNKVLKEESLKFESIRKTSVKDTISSAITVSSGANTDEATTQYVANYDKLQEVQAKNINYEIDKNNTKNDETIIKSAKNELPSENVRSSILGFNLPKFGNASKDMLHSHVDLTLTSKKRIPNSKESKNYEYEQVSVKPVVNTTEKEVQGQKSNLNLKMERKLLLDDFKGSNDYKDIKISVTQNLNHTTDNFNFTRKIKLLLDDYHTTVLSNASASVERTGKNNSVDLITPADFKNDKTTLFETTTEENVYTTHENYKNEKLNPKISKNYNYEQVDDYKATTISVIQNLNYKKVLTNSRPFVERTDKTINSDLIILADPENNKTTLFETATAAHFYTIQNKSTNEMASASDLFELENRNSTYSKTNTTQAIEIAVVPGNQPEKNNVTKPLRSLDFESDVKNITNEAKLIDNKKYENLVKDIPPTQYLAILKTKYVETLPQELDHVEVQIPKSVVNKDTKLSPLQKNIKTYEVFEVDPDKSLFHLRPVNTNKNNREAPYYAPVHDYGLKNAFFNALNRLGPSYDDKDHNVLEVEPDEFSLRSLNSKNSNQGEPHFAPVHSYEPANAYFNPQNHLGPNYDDKEKSKNLVYRRDENVSNFTEDYYLRDGKDKKNVNRTFGFGVKKNPEDRKFKAVSVDTPSYTKKSKTANPDDYIDMDYFFGRSKTNKKYHEINTFDNKLPSIRVELKNNLKANLKRERIKSRTDLVSRILKELKAEEKTSRSGHGFAADYYWSRIASGSIEDERKFNILRSNDQKGNLKHNLQNVISEAKIALLDLQVFSNNYVDYDELTNKNEEKKDVNVLITKDKIPIEALEIIKEILKVLPPEQLEQLKNVKPSASEEVFFNQILPLIKSADGQEITEEKQKEVLETIVQKIIKILPAILEKLSPILEKFISLKGPELEKILGNTLPHLLRTDDTKQDDDTIKPKDSQENNDKMIPEESKNNPKPKGSEEIDEFDVDVESKIQLRKKKKKFLRSREQDITIEPYVEAMTTLIKNESEGLKRYNWLGTTVGLQAALDKLIDLTESDSDEMIHPNDKSRLTYTQFLYESAREVISADPSLELKILQLKKGIVPKNFKKSKYKRRDAVALLNEYYLSGRIVLESDEDGNASVTDNNRKEDKGSKEQLQHFLVDLRSGLSQFHNALKHISLVTKYENQRWYKNLKELYLGTRNRKQLLEILLHIFSTRVFDLIEASAKNDLKDSVISYVLNHKEEVLRTKTEFVLVIKILNEIKMIEYVS